MPQQRAQQVDGGVERVGPVGAQGAEVHAVDLDGQHLVDIDHARHAQWLETEQLARVKAPLGIAGDLHPPPSSRSGSFHDGPQRMFAIALLLDVDDPGPAPLLDPALCLRGKSHDEPRHVTRSPPSQVGTINGARTYHTTGRTTGPGCLADDQSGDDQVGAYAEMRRTRRAGSLRSADETKTPVSTKGTVRSNAPCTFLGGRSARSRWMSSGSVSVEAPQPMNASSGSAAGADDRGLNTDGADQRARPEGIEPPTRGLEVRRSIRLSYGRLSRASVPAAAGGGLRDGYEYGGRSGCRGDRGLRRRPWRRPEPGSGGSPWCRARSRP